MENIFQKYQTFFALIIVGILIAGAIIMPKPSIPPIPTTETPVNPDQITPITTEIMNTFLASGRIVLGNKNSNSIVIEVSDPSCPFCHFASGLNPELVAQTDMKQFITPENGGSYIAPVPELKNLANNGDIAYVYSFGNGHGNGYLAAEALYCAYEQGKFWQAHDLFMSNTGYTLINETVKNDRTKSNLFASFLKTAVDEKFMTDCLTAKKYLPMIDRDISENSLIGFKGTPHFVINTQPFPGAQSFINMKDALKK